MKFIISPLKNDYTSGSSEMGVRMQSRLQSLVASGKINLDAIKRYDDDPNIGPYHAAADHDQVFAM